MLLSPTRSWYDRGEEATNDDASRVAERKDTTCSQFKLTSRRPSRKSETGVRPVLPEMPPNDYDAFGYF